MHGGTVHLASMRLGSNDKAYKILITGPELEELKRHTWEMVDAFGLDLKIEQYKGSRPIGLYRWDMDCLTDVGFAPLDVEIPKASGSGWVEF